MNWKRKLDNRFSKTIQIVSLNWMAQLLRLVGGVIIWGYAARKLGFEDLGILGIAYSVSSITGNIGQLGIETKIIRDIRQNRYQKESIFATSVYTRIAAHGGLLVVMCIIAWLASPNDGKLILILSLLGIGNLASSLRSIESLWIAQDRLQELVGIELQIVVFGFVVKAVALSSGLGPAGLGCMIALEIVARGAMLTWKEERSWEWLNPKNINFEYMSETTEYAREILPSLFFGAFICNIEVVFAGWTSGVRLAGMYTSTQRLTQSALIIPISAIGLLTGKLMTHDGLISKKRIQDGYGAAIAISGMVSVAVVLFSGLLSDLMLGVASTKGQTLLQVQSINIVAMTLYSYRKKCLMLKGEGRFVGRIAMRTGLLSAGLMTVLGHIWGVWGICIATPMSILLVTISERGRGRQT